MAVSSDILTCPVEHIDMHAPDVLKQPHAFYKRLLQSAPVVRDEKSGIYQISSYELVRQVLADTDTFSNRIRHALHGKNSGSEMVASIMAEGFPRPDTLQTSDPPIHTRSRKLVNKAFTPRRVESMGEEIEQVADQLIDAFAARGEMEFVNEFAYLLPMTVIAKQLGVPLSDMPKFKRWSDAFAAQFSHVTDEKEEAEIARQVVEFQRYFADVIEQKRQSPTDDIISDIATADLSEEGDSTRLDTPEALQIIQQILVAGNETTASSMTEGMYQIIQNPDLMQAIVTEENVLKHTVEEIIRFSSPVQAMWRVALKDTEIGGVAIPKNAIVLVRFAAANCDQTIFENGEVLDTERPKLRRHVAFGHGIHACIGAPLARKEMQISYLKLFSRLKEWRIAPDQPTIDYQAGVLLRGIKELKLQFTPVT